MTNACGPSMAMPWTPNARVSGLVPVRPQGKCCRLRVAPDGLAFFGPGLAGFAGVLRLAGEDLVTVFELQCRLQGDAVDRLVQYLLGEAQPERAGLAHDSIGDGEGGGHKLF